ncbi:hypothetical protein [Falsiroseomonas sp. HW251]|uniref:hypothetical protein n=1 Tax=Falsiroseomonas sp. HW251 TaxID=3390998 RepID=UPI003D310E06
MRVFGLLFLAPLVACSPDYSAVRDWSSQARDAVLPAEVTIRPIPAVIPVPPAPVTRDGQAGAAMALQEGAAAWLGMLAFLADDGWPRQRENPLADHVAKVQPYDAEGAAALNDLGELMAYAARRNTRAPWLRTAIERGDPSFQKVMASLLRQSDALAAQGAAPALLELPRNATALQRALAEELAAARQAEAGRRRVARDARAAAMARVAEGHAFMAAHTGDITKADTVRLLRVQEQELRRLTLLGVAG